MPVGLVLWARLGSVLPGRRGDLPDGGVSVRRCFGRRRCAYQCHCWDLHFGGVAVVEVRLWDAWW